jgi:hypothetical protein
MTLQNGNFNALTKANDVLDFVYDGAKWACISETETAWTTLSLAADWSGTIQYKRKLNNLVLRGNITKTTGSSTSYQTAITMPTGLRPLQQVEKGIVFNFGGVPLISTIRITTAGLLSFNGILNVSDFAYLDDVSIELN